jgi:molybdopterin-binding protein/molybdate transport repressor ModE-like protein
MSRAPTVTSTDVALLRSLGRARSVVDASRAVGISRDRAVYRLDRLARAFGGPVVASIRGGRAHGGSVLTPLGDRIARGGFESVELLDGRPLAAFRPPNRLSGTYHRTPSPRVRVGRTLDLAVAFPAEDGARVSVLLDPEAVVVARRRFPSSARNVLPGRVEAIARGPSGLGATLVVRCGAVRLRVAVTDEPIRQLRLAPGARVLLYVKATALRPVGRAARPRRTGARFSP